MQRQKKYFLVILLSAIILVSSTFFLALQNPSKTPSLRNHDLEWADIINSTVTYDFNIYTMGSHESIQEYWYPLNNTQIEAKYVRLPKLPNKISAEAFIEEIGDSEKVQISMQNGTIINSTVVPAKELLSLFSFPVEDWQFIESLFSSTVELEYPVYGFKSRYYYIGSIMSNGEYKLQQDWEEGDWGHGGYSSTAHGLINMTDGIPNCVEYYYLYSHVYGFDYTITLTRTYE